MLSSAASLYVIKGRKSLLRKFINDEGQKKFQTETRTNDTLTVASSRLRAPSFSSQFELPVLPPTTTTLTSTPATLMTSMTLTSTSTKLLTTATAASYVLEHHPSEDGYVGDLNVIDVESELYSPVRQLPGLREIGRIRSLDEKMSEATEFCSTRGLVNEFGSHPAISGLGKGHPGIGELGPGPIFGERKGHPGIGSLGHIGGHPGIGQLGPAKGHPGLGMLPPSCNPPEDETGVIRVKTIGVLQPPSFAEDQSRPLALAMPLGSVPGRGEDPTSLYCHPDGDSSQQRHDNLGDGISDRDAQREMSELEFALQNLNPTEVERRRKVFQQQQYR